MTEKESFDLNGNARNNYVNLILNDMKVYNFWRMQQYNVNGSILRTMLALNVLLGDMPPEGQKFMRADMAKVGNGNQCSYEELQLIYQKAMGWLWENLLQETFKAKPLSSEKAHLRAEQ